MSDLVVFQDQLPVNTLVEQKPLADGEQVLIRFGTYGASVVRHSGSYGGRDGLWELAAIRWDDSVAGLDGPWEFVGADFNLDFMDYDDVKGWLTGPEVIEILEKIMWL